MNYRIIFTSLVAVIFLTAVPAWAAQNLGLNTFVKDTPAIAASVNENFTAMEQAVPVMWASIDQDPVALTFTSPTGSFGGVINSFSSIKVPEPGGILLINGSVFVNNDDAAPQVYTLNPLIDGVPKEGHSFQSLYYSQGQSSGPVGEGFTLSYTYATAVAATAYTVSQELRSGNRSMFTFNKNNMTVIFFPSLPGGASINNPGIPLGAIPFVGGLPECEVGDFCY